MPTGVLEKTQKNIVEVIRLLEKSDSVIKAANRYRVQLSPSILSEIRQKTSECLKEAQALCGGPILDLQSACEAFTAALELPALDAENLRGEAALWRDAVFLSVQDELHKLLLCSFELNKEDAQSLLSLVEHSPFDRTSKSIFWINTALFCAQTEPMLAYEYMLKAFQTTPDLITYLGEGQNADYRFEPETHPQKTIKQCPACAGEGVAYYNALSCHAAKFNSLYYPAKLWMHCQACYNLYSYQFPEELMEENGPPNHTEPNYNAKRIFAASLEDTRFWNGLLNDLSGYTREKSLLTIGAGNGMLLAAALEMGYFIDVVEPDFARAQEISNMLDYVITCGDALCFTTAKRYSVLIMDDMIGRHKDPAALFKKAYELLEDSGVLWLSAPNYRSSYTRLKRFDDDTWQDPTSLMWFSYEGIKKILADCGFEVRQYTVSARRDGAMELIATKIGKGK